MDCARNIITANFSGGGTSATTAPLWQWDYGQALCITGIDLPAAFEVHFSTNRTGGVSTVAVGADGQVTIPNELLTIGKNLNAWIYLSDAQGEGETEYSILIPVKARPMPETYDAEVTGEFDDVVRQVSEYAETAQTAADNAGASASAAATSASEAAASASAAESAKTAAETAQGEAEDAQTAAETAAQTATEKAQQSAQDAAQAALDAGRAESAAGSAEAAQTGAESAKADAETAAQGAADSASAASASATSAGQAATSAGQSATAAAQSAASIEGDVQTAAQKAAEATAAANQAVAAKDSAVTAQHGAETSATNAGQSASTASTKASEAAQSASNAAASETAAEAAATRAEQAAASLVVDDALSDTSTNPVQNKVITGEVTQLKNAITAGFNINNFVFEWGNIYNGSINSEQNRIHSVDMIWLPRGSKIKTVANFANFGCPRYNLDGSYAENGSWTQEYTALSDCYVRIVIRKRSGNIEESEFADIIGTLSIFYATTAESYLYNMASANSKKTALAEELRNEYGILDVDSSDNADYANLFDVDSPGTSTTGYYDRTNTFVSSTTLGSTDFIRCFPGFEYYVQNINAGFFVLWYDESKTFLTYTNVLGNNVKFVPVLNAAYMRTLIVLSNINIYAVRCDAIKVIKAKKSAYDGKNGVAFGTSLTYRAQTTGGYLQYLPALSGANIENKGLGNSTILDNGSNPKMMDVITGYTGYSAKDFAILEGFVNDWYNNAALLGSWKDTGTDTVCGCVRTALIYILTQNPSITLIVIIDPIGKSASGVDCSSLAVRGGYTQSEFYDEIAKVAHSIGVPVIRVDRKSGMSELTPYMYIDNIHPSAEGAEQTAKTIWAEMQTVSIKVIDA